MTNYYTLATTAMATDSVTQFVPSLSTFLGTGLDAHIAIQGLSDHASGSSACLRFQKGWLEKCGQIW